MILFTLSPKHKYKKKIRLGKVIFNSFLKGKCENNIFLNITIYCVKVLLDDVRFYRYENFPPFYYLTLENSQKLEAKMPKFKIIPKKTYQDFISDIQAVFIEMTF